MSGLQETKDSHSHHPAGGWGAKEELEVYVGSRGPSVQRADCEGFSHGAGSRYQDMAI